MARRRTPPRSEVESVLRPLAAIRRRIEKANAERDALIAAADAHDPRPTNKQIGDELGISEAAVRQVLAARSLNDPEANIAWQAHGKTKGPGDDPSGLERASRRKAQTDREGP